MVAIPVLTLAMLDGEPSERKEFIFRLTAAAHDVGFFYLCATEVSPSFLAKVSAMTRRFFLLTEEEKSSLAMINSPHFRGYNRAGSERTNGKSDWREQFDIGAEREPYQLTNADPVWMGLHGYNQWPDSLPELKSIMLDYNNLLTEIALKLLRALAAGLGLPDDAFDGIYGDRPNEHIKLIKYPPMASAQEAQGVGAHKDSGLLTLILQDENKGLQVEVFENEWIDVLPVKNTFVVNLGELLELATNGYLRATVHRVVPPEGKSERISIAWFLGASLDSVVPVFDLPKKLTSGASLIKTDPQNPLLREVGLNYMKGRIRSHPDVAEKFYKQWTNDEE